MKSLNIKIHNRVFSFCSEGHIEEVSQREECDYIFPQDTKLSIICLGLNSDKDMMTILETEKTKYGYLFLIRRFFENPRTNTLDNMNIDIFAHNIGYSQYINDELY